MDCNNENKSIDGDYCNGNKFKLLTRGGANMSDAEILEMLLCYAVNNEDAGGIAEELIKEYTTISCVVQSNSDDIIKKYGLGTEAKLLLMLLNEMILRTAILQSDKNLSEKENLRDYLLDLFHGKTTEIVYALYFAADGGFVGRQLIYHGKISEVNFSLRRITEGVFRVGGKSVILAHNHPSQILVPSYDDYISTKRIAAHLEANEVTLIDHYIVGDGRIVGILHPDKD